MQFVRDFSERQSQLVFLIFSFIVQYEPPELHPLVDDDVSEATGALASTYETASRGVIYEHRPASLPADRLLTALKPVVAEAGHGGGSAFDRDAAVVLRHIADAVGGFRGEDPQNARAFIELLMRVIRNERPGSPGGSGSDDLAGEGGSDRHPSPASRLIVP